MGLSRTSRGLAGLWCLFICIHARLAASLAWPTVLVPSVDQHAFRFHRGAQSGQTRNQMGPGCSAGAAEAWLA